jgi:hypothetical protein
MRGDRRASWITTSHHSHAYRDSAISAFATAAPISRVARTWPPEPRRTGIPGARCIYRVRSMKAEQTDSGSKPTRWDIQREVGGPAAYESAKGRLFSVGDTVVLPPMWTMRAVSHFVPPTLPRERVRHSSTMLLVV